LGLEFVNSEDDRLSNSVILNGITVKIQDKEGNPINNLADAISRFAIVDYNNPTVVFGEVSNFGGQSKIPLTLSYPDTISPTEPDSIDLIVDIAPQASISNFKIVIDSASSINIVEMHSTKQPILKDDNENSGPLFKIESDFAILMADNLKDSFRNYPNPFGNSSRETTTFIYYLKEDTDVQIKIYTLLGELVWSRSYKKTEPQGRVGSHDGSNSIVWNARNDKGYKVLNGVYVAYITTGFGESTYTKVAVLK